MTFFLFVGILGLLIIVHEWGHFIAAKKQGVKVEQFSIGFGPRLLRRKKGDTEYSLSLVPLGGYVKLAGDSLEDYQRHPEEYLSKPPGRRFWIIVCGPLLNYLLGFVFFWMIFFFGYPTLTTQVGGLLDDYGAKSAGVEIGDRIMAVEGKEVKLWEELQEAIQEHKDAASVTLSVLRKDQTLQLTVGLKTKEMMDLLGESRKVVLLGISPAEEIVQVRHGFIQSFGLGAMRTWDLTALTYEAFWRMCTGKLSVRESVTGPLGIYYVTSKAARQGLVAIMHLIAVLSISLGIFNLLPLPVMDGGHVVLLGIEKLRGRYLSLRTEKLITQIGLTVIITIAVLVTYNDLLRFGGSLVKHLVK